MLIYGWFTLLYNRNQCNIVKQLSSKLKKKKTIPGGPSLYNTEIYTQYIIIT